MLRKLMKCPYCGGKPEVVCSWTGMAYVQCTACGMSSPRRDCRDGEAAGKINAVVIWNDIAGKYGKDIENPEPGSYVEYRDEVLPDGEAPATERQTSYAEAIAAELNLELPLEKSKDEYRRFISAHVDEYNKLKSRRIYGWYESEDDEYICDPND